MEEKGPYRQTVCMLTFKEDKFLLINLIHFEDDCWKFPQGGVDEGESIIQTAKREFEEELGTTKFQIIKELEFKHKYEWPEELKDKMEKKYKIRYLGQCMNFVIVKFMGEDKDIKPRAGEVKKYKWVTKEDLIEYSKLKEPDFYQDYYTNVLKAMQDLDKF